MYYLFTPFVTTPRSRLRFATLIIMRDLSEQNTKELLDGIDDVFIHRLFSPGILSMVRPGVDRDTFPINRDVALAIIKERRANPFKRPDMPYPMSVTASRMLTPYVAGSIQTMSLSLSGLMWNYQLFKPEFCMIPAASGTIMSLYCLLKKRISSLPHFEKHYPKFQYRPILGGSIDPLTIGLICKYRKFYH